MKKVLVIGGAGYVGTELVDSLIEDGYLVTVYDLFIYGKNFQSKQNLKLLKGDVRDIKKLEEVIENQDFIIHLACISNDPSFELNPELSRSINFDCFEPLVKIAKDKGVKRFIFASSSSVYGLKKEQDVNENFSLEPLTDYSKYKAMCEDILLRYGDDKFTCSILRPATVCGYSRRQRFDLVVNILTNHAFNTGKIKIFGGEQLRPNIHIQDMVSAYMLLLKIEKNKISNNIFNVGFHNNSVNQLAEIVDEVVGPNLELIRIKTDDNRSYHISSKKVKEQLGFNTKYTIKDAVNDIKNSFEKKLFTNSLENENYFNIKKMQKINLI